MWLTLVAAMGLGWLVSVLALIQADSRRSYAGMMERQNRDSEISHLLGAIEKAGFKVNRRSDEYSGRTYEIALEPVSK
jgi:hypothetical protein